MKFQISKNKFQININNQITFLNQTNIVLDFEFVGWILFGTWNLVFVFCVFELGIYYRIYKYFQVRRMI